MAHKIFDVFNVFSWNIIPLMALVYKKKPTGFRHFNKGTAKTWFGGLIKINLHGFGLKGRTRRFFLIDQPQYTHKPLNITQINHLMYNPHLLFKPRKNGQM